VSRLLPSSPGARAVVAIVAFFVVANVAALLVSTVRPEPSGAGGSAYATQPRGAAAYAELLRRNGHALSYLRDDLAQTRLDPATTVVLLDAPDVARGDRDALARFVRAGGRLVAGGEDAGRGVLPRAPTWSPAGPKVTIASAPGTVGAGGVPETRTVRRVQSAGDGGFTLLHGAQAALGQNPALLAVARAGRGRALLLADSAPLQNRLLARADNAALGLALAGPRGRPVLFVESVHGFGQETGLAALPSRWRWALAVALLAALVALLSQARRLGPAEQTGADPPPARREHVEALALALRRAREPQVALQPVREAARAQVIRRAALAPDVGDEALGDAARRLGFQEDEVAAIMSEPGNHSPSGDVSGALGRALARGRR
jgi:hypothetical protein